MKTALQASALSSIYVAAVLKLGQAPLALTWEVVASWAAVSFALFTVATLTKGAPAAAA
jgi:hypothetical protein